MVQSDLKEAVAAHEKFAGGLLSGESWKADLLPDATIEQVLQVFKDKMKDRKNKGAKKNFKATQKAVKSSLKMAKACLKFFNVNDHDMFAQAHDVLRAGEVTESEGNLCTILLTSEPSAAEVQIEMAAMISSSLEDKEKPTFVHAAIISKAQQLMAD